MSAISILFVCEFLKIVYSYQCIAYSDRNYEIVSLLTDINQRENVDESNLDDVLANAIIMPLEAAHYENGEGDHSLDHNLDRRGWEALDIGTRNWRTIKPGKRGWETFKRGWEAIRRGWEPVRRGWESLKRQEEYLTRGWEPTKKQGGSKTTGDYESTGADAKEPSAQRTMCLCCTSLWSESCCKWCQALS